MDNFLEPSFSISGTSQSYLMYDTFPDKKRYTKNKETLLNYYNNKGYFKDKTGCLGDFSRHNSNMFYKTYNPYNYTEQEIENYINSLKNVLPFFQNITFLGIINSECVFAVNTPFIKKLNYYEQLIRIYPIRAIHQVTQKNLIKKYNKALEQGLSDVDCLNLFDFFVPTIKNSSYSFSNPYMYISLQNTGKENILLYNDYKNLNIRKGYSNSFLNTIYKKIINKKEANLAKNIFNKFLISIKNEDYVSAISLMKKSNDLYYFNTNKYKFNVDLFFNDVIKVLETKLIFIKTWTGNLTIYDNKNLPEDIKESFYNTVLYNINRIKELEKLHQYNFLIYNNKIYLYEDFFRYYTVSNIGIHEFKPEDFIFNLKKYLIKI